MYVLPSDFAAELSSRLITESCSEERWRRRSLGNVSKLPLSKLFVRMCPMSTSKSLFFVLSQFIKTSSRSSSNNLAILQASITFHCPLLHDVCMDWHVISLMSNIVLNLPSYQHGGHGQLAVTELRLLWQLTYILLLQLHRISTSSEFEVANLTYKKGSDPSQTWSHKELLFKSTDSYWPFLLSVRTKQMRSNFIQISI